MKNDNDNDTTPDLEPIDGNASIAQALAAIGEGVNNLLRLEARRALGFADESENELQGRLTVELIRYSPELAKALTDLIALSRRKLERSPSETN